MDFLDYPKIVTQRCVLRLITKSDVAFTFQLRSHPEVGKYIGRPLAKNSSEAETHITKVLKFMAENASINWVICKKEITEDIGTICLWNFSEDRKTAEVGYDSLPEFNRKGYMTEALQAVIHFGFNNLQLNTIEAFTSKHNKGSIALLEKNNFDLQPDRKDEGYPENIIYSLSF